MKNLLSIILLMISFLIPGILHAQVQMNLQKPSVKRLQVNDLFNVQLNNPLNENRTVYIIAEVTEAERGNIARFRTEDFNLSPGLKRLNPSQVQITDREFFSSEGRDVISRTGNFPSGNYTINLTLYNITDDDQLATSSLDHEVVNVYQQSGDRASQEESWINTFGSAYVESQVANRQGAGQQIPRNFLRGNLDAGIELGPVPLGVQGFYSTESRSYRQNMNTITFSFHDQRFINNLRNELTEVIKHENEAKAEKFGEAYGKLEKLENINQVLEDPNLQDEFKELDNLDKIEQQIEDLDLEEAVNEIEEVKNNIRSRSRELNYKARKQKLTAEIEAYRSVSYENEQKENEREEKLDSLRQELNGLEQQKQSVQEENEKDREMLENLRDKKEKYNDLLKKKNKLSELKARKKQFEALKEQKDQLQNFKDQLMEEGDLEDLESFDLGKLADKKVLKDQLLKRDMLSTGSNMLLGIEELEAGTIYPYYSPLVLNGIQATGINFQWSPSWFYFAFAGGTSNRPVFSVQQGIANYKQRFLGGKIGAGKKNDNHIYLTSLYAVDDRNSIDSQDTTLKAQSNFIMGFDGRLSLFDDALNIQAEIAGSRHSRNIDATTIESDNEFYSSTPDFLKPSLAAAYGLAYDIRGGLRLFDRNTVLSGYFRNIDPSYNSFGAPNLRRGINVYQVKLSQKIFNDQVVISAFRKNESTTRLWSQNIVYYERNGGELVLRARNLPRLRARYAYSAQDAENAGNDIQDLMITGNYGYPAGDLYLSNTLSFSQNTASSTVSQGPSYSINNYLFNQTVSFTMPLTFSVNVNYIASERRSIERKTWISDFSASVQLWKKLNLTAGANYKSTADQQERIGGLLEANYALGDHLTLDLQFNNNYFDDMVMPVSDFEEYILRGRVAVNW